MARCWWGTRRCGRSTASTPAAADAAAAGADGGPAPVALLTEPGKVGPIGMPSALAVGPDGSVYIGDLETQRIYAMPAEGAARAGAEPTEIARLPGVRGLAFGPTGDLFAVTSDADQVRRLAPPADGTGGGAWAMTVAVADRPFGFGHHVAVSPEGALFVADNYERCVWKILPDGGGFAEPAKLAAGEPLDGPVGLAWDGTHDPPRLLVADPRAKKLFAVDPDGGAVRVVAE